MAEYHVGCGIAGIYAGRLNKKGNMWLDKSDVTDEVLNCAFDYLYINKKELRGEVDGEKYVLRIVLYEEESEDHE